MINSKIKEKVLNLPSFPGVYIIKNREGKIIYIGKAKNLKNRVSQYFIEDRIHSEKVQKMVQSADDFDYIITDDEFEALVLECSLIKRHIPKYNILLKDGKGYSYIKITNEIWSRIKYTKKKENDDAIYFGPYTSSFSVRNTAEIVNRIFKMPTCSRDLTKRSKRPCLNYHINLCNAPCIGKVTLDDYKITIEEAVNFLKNGSSKTLKILEEKMRAASENLNFEKAAEYRDKIQSIKNIKLKQKVVSNKIKEQDIIAFANDKKAVSVQVFRFSDGDLYESENFLFDFDEDLVSIRTEFLKRFYTLRNNVPKNIVIDGEIENEELILRWLLNKSDSKSVNLHKPQRGEQLKLLKMCETNARDALLRTTKYENKTEKILKEFCTLLELKNIPNKIEAYDISNLQGSDNVGGMVVFEKGLPFKAAYRKFKIRTIDGQDDYGSIREVLERRIYNLIQKTDNNFSKIPDLILIDGGKKQVAAVKEVLKNFEMEVPVFGMVKDKKHHTRALTTENKEIEIKPISSIFAFITRIQDEVHRFTIGYHKNLRNKRMKTSEITKIKGIGEKTAKRILKERKSKNM